MRTTVVRAVAAAAAVAVAATAMGSSGTAAAQSVDWEVLELAPLTEGDITTVFDINETGGMAGQSEDLPVVWTPDGEPFALPLPDGYVGGVAFSLNDKLQAVGLVWTADDDARAVVWDQGDTTLLGVNDLVDEISPEGVMLGVDLTGLLDDDCCVQGFVQEVGGPKFPLTAPPTVDVFPAALTDSGIAVGTVIAPDLFVVGAGWYEQYVFPIGGITNDTYLEPVDVIAAPAVLALRNDGEGVSSVLVNRFGQVVPLASPSPYDLATDLNSWGVAVGAGGNSLNEGPLVGRLYAYGQAISLDTLVAPSEHDFDIHDPIALNDDFSIVGNSVDGSSWLLRPSTGTAAAALRAGGDEVESGATEDLAPHRGEPPSPAETRFGWRSDESSIPTPG